MNKMTDAQKRLLKEIRRYIKAHDRPPSRTELAAEIEVNINAISYQLKKLSELGKIELTPKLARGIRVL